ncbi:MAG: hypothetical protein JXR07_03700 [Reichenbachiella sp.]
MGLATHRSDELNLAAEHVNHVPKNTFFQRFRTSVVWNKIVHWEFWPFWLVYSPMFFYWTWITLRTRSFFFFTAANQGMEFGGLLGGSKYKILKSIPAEYLPKTYPFPSNVSMDSFLKKITKEGLNFPIILKPDIGERGFMVELIKCEEMLKNYLDQIKVDFMVQEYVTFPVELGVFYYRFPDQKKGTVSSVTLKELLSVEGDGIRNVEELMHESVRAKMHIKELKVKEEKLLSYRPEKNEIVEIVSIGNHCRGTKFINGNHLINDQLIDVFDRISQKIVGFQYGRYDLRCMSLEDLYVGKNIKILELNGAGAEPAHIYHPGNSILHGYRDIIFHLSVLKDISLINHKNGIPYLSFWPGVKELWKIWKYARLKAS